MKRPTFPPKPPAPSFLPILGPAIERARKLKPTDQPVSHGEVVEDIGRSVVLPPGLLDQMRDLAKRRDGGAE